MDLHSCALEASDPLDTLDCPAPVLQILASTELRLGLRAWLARASSGTQPQFVFGASSRLGARLQAGESADVVLMAQIDLAQALLPEGETALPIARDRLVLAARPDLRLTHGDLLQRLQSSTLRLGSALADAGEESDPARILFDRIDQAHPGVADMLRSRARPLTSRGEPPSHRQVMELLVSGQMDVVIGLHSALRTLSQVADVLAPPAPFGVEIIAGVAVLASGGPRRVAAERFVACLRGPEGQALLQRHGFEAVLPTL